MDVSPNSRRGIARRVGWLMVMLFWTVQAVAYPVVFVVNTPSSVVVWLVGPILELVFIAMVLGTWSRRRG